MEGVVDEGFGWARVRGRYMMMTNYKQAPNAITIASGHQNNLIGIRVRREEKGIGGRRW